MVFRIRTRDLLPILLFIFDYRVTVPHPILRLNLTRRVDRRPGGFVRINFRQDLGEEIRVQGTRRRFSRSKFCGANYVPIRPVRVIMTETIPVSLIPG